MCQEGDEEDLGLGFWQQISPLTFAGFREVRTAWVLKPGLDQAKEDWMRQEGSGWW